CTAWLVAPRYTGFSCRRDWMATHAAIASDSVWKTVKMPSPSSFTTRPLCCSKVLDSAPVSCVTKRPAVSSPRRSKMPVLPTRSAKTTVATILLYPERESEPRYGRILCRGPLKQQAQGGPGHQDRGD